MTATIYHDDKGEQLEVIEIPDEFKAQAEEYRTKLHRRARPPSTTP